MNEDNYFERETPAEQQSRIDAQIRSNVDAGLAFEAEKKKWQDAVYPYDLTPRCCRCLSQHAIFAGDEIKCAAHWELVEAVKAAGLTAPTDDNAQEFMAQGPKFRELRERFAHLYEVTK